ncbi:MAG: biotin carboxylase N-terminal domain-containing protein, partial [Chloroflexota bacterium]
MIRRLLIANRGEIARRIARTCASLGIETVAVFSDADADALFARESMRGVHLPGNSSAETYLRIDLIVDAALRSGSDAVHPGYGFLAENPAFAQAVLDAGLTWVGPPPSAMASMGSKIEAKRLMRAAGVSVLPEGDDAGFPALVKASAGGGGRGMRIVRSADELAAAVEAAQREALAAFGDSTVFIERYVERGRHIEIQVFADQHGQCVSLFERECSIQRRHQKIVEECPSPAVSEALRAEMGAAAEAAARAVSYVGAGTVEFLLAPDGRFYFLEMNTRLQVEHPVTELVTGLDLVAMQIRVAEGAPLPPVALAPSINGHAVEVRLCAEDPAGGYLPQTGRLARFEVPNLDNVRVDTGVESGSEVSPYYDSMIAKVVAWGVTREEAARTLAQALAGSRLHGVTTNRDQLLQVLRHPEFLAGNIDTGFLERNPCTTRNTDGYRLAAVAAALVEQAANRAGASVLASTPSGWRNVPSQDQIAEFTTLEGDAITVGYP